MPGNKWLDHWTPEEDAVVLDPDLSIAVAAGRLGRTEAAVHGRRQRLRGTATKYEMGAHPYVLPGRGDWLIAKTCFGCGQFLPAESFHRRPERMGSWSVKCKTCHNREARRALDARQDASQATAGRKGQPWEDDEISAVLLSDLPVAELAESLGRTYASVVRAKSKALAAMHTPTQAAGLLQIPVSVIHNWHARGEVEPVDYLTGVTSRGGKMPLYRLSDLVERASDTRARRQKRLSPDQIRGVLDMALGGASLEDISEQYDLGSSGARYLIGAHATPDELAQIKQARADRPLPPRAKRGPDDPVVAAQIIADRVAGKTPTEIAAAFGKTPQAVYGLIRRWATPDQRDAIRRQSAATKNRDGASSAP